MTTFGPTTRTALLSSWIKPSSDNEKDQQDRAERMIIDAVKAHPAFAGTDIRVYAKGSYANNTNVWRDSDVDIVVEHQDCVYYEFFDCDAPPPGRIAPYTGGWTPERWRREVTNAVVNCFGSSDVDRLVHLTRPLEPNGMSQPLAQATLRGAVVSDGGRRMTQQEANHETSPKPTPDRAQGPDGHNQNVALEASSTSELTPLRRAFPDDEARAHVLNASRREMYDSLGLFHAHVKSVISLMFTIATAVLAVVGFAIKENTPQAIRDLVLTAAPLILVLIVPFGIVSILVIGRYYKLYVAALVYAARLHADEGVGAHQWFADVERLRAQLGPSVSERKLVDMRAYGWPHSWSLYAILIALIGLGALALAIFLWVKL